MSQWYPPPASKRTGPRGQPGVTASPPAPDADDDGYVQGGSDIGAGELTGSPLSSRPGGAGAGRSAEGSPHPHIPLRYLGHRNSGQHFQHGPASLPGHAQLPPQHERSVNRSRCSHVQAPTTLVAREGPAASRCARARAVLPAVSVVRPGQSRRVRRSIRECTVLRFGAGAPTSRASSTGAFRSASVSRGLPAS
jgi:hypothetical protein